MNVTFPGSYEAYNTQYAGQIETIGFCLYDTVTYTSGTTTLSTLFNAVRATIDLGNMRLAGALPSPIAFLIRAVRFFNKHRPRSSAFDASAAVQNGASDNMCLLTNTGVFSLTIGAKNYGQIPLWMLTSGGGVAPSGLDGVATDFRDYATLGIPDPRAVYTLSKPLFIAPQINFFVELTWPAAVTLEGGDTTIQIVLDGDQLRPVQ